MVKKRVPNTESEFLDCLTEFLLDLSDCSITELKEDIRARGIDPEQLINKVQNLVNKNLANYRIKQAKKEMEGALKEIKRILMKTPENRNEVRNKLEKILPSLSDKMDPQAVQIYFHKLRNLENEDLDSLLEDIKKLELLKDKLDKEEDK